MTANGHQAFLSSSRGTRNIDNSLNTVSGKVKMGKSNTFS